jgi:hypothetical protein
VAQPAGRRRRARTPPEPVAGSPGRHAAGLYCNAVAGSQRRLAHRNLELLPDPHGEILQPPANYTVDRRRRATLDDVRRGFPLAVVQLAGVPRRLGVDQAFRAAGVEPHNPVPNGLQPDAADPRRPGPGAAIVDLGQRQQPPTLTCIPGRMANLLANLLFARRESDSHRSENPE